MSLEERRRCAVGEASSHLTLREQRVEQPPRVVDGDVVEDGHPAGLAVDLDDGDVGDEAVRRRGGDPVVVVGRKQVRRGVVRRHREPRLHPLGQRFRIPVCGPGDAPERRRLVAEVRRGSRRSSRRAGRPPPRPRRRRPRRSETSSCPTRSSTATTTCRPRPEPRSRPGSTPRRSATIWAITVRWP